jgi:hypothetical protein
MSSNVQVYSKGVVVDDLPGNPIFETTDEVSVYLKDIDARDFVSEFPSHEVLDAMDISDVIKWLDAQESLESDDFLNE